MNLPQYIVEQVIANKDSKFCNYLILSSDIMLTTTLKSVVKSSY